MASMKKMTRAEAVALLRLLADRLEASKDKDAYLEVAEALSDMLAIKSIRDLVGEPPP